MCVVLLVLMQNKVDKMLTSDILSTFLAGWLTVLASNCSSVWLSVLGSLLGVDCSLYKKMTTSRDKCLIEYY